jgi:hypothetical protein
MTREQGLTMEQELERAVLLERLRRRQPLRRAASAASRPTARATRAVTSQGDEERPAG